MSEEQTPRTWGLTRASTLRQSESPATQREIIGRACQSLTLGEPIFLNEPLGTSGRTKRFAERSMGNYVMRTLRKGDTLVVTAIDRLGRNFIDQYTTIQILFDRGIRIIILKPVFNSIRSFVLGNWLFREWRSGLGLLAWCHREFLSIDIES